MLGPGRVSTSTGNIRLPPTPAAARMRGPRARKRHGAKALPQYSYRLNEKSTKRDNFGILGDLERFQAIWQPATPWRVKESLHPSLRGPIHGLFPPPTRSPDAIDGLPAAALGGVR